MGITYDATINSGSVTVDQSITIQSLFLNGGSLSAAFDLNLNEGLVWTGGGVSGSGAINLEAGSTSTISGSALTLDGATINNSGTVSQTTDVGGNGIINNLTGATWNVSNVTINAVFNNSGSVAIQALGTDYTALAFMGGGTSSGSFAVGANSKLVFLPNFATQTDNTYTLSGATISGAGATENDSNMMIGGNTSISTSFFNRGFVTVQAGAALTLTGDYSSDLRGGIFLAGGTLTSAQLINVGFNSNLGGSGIVNGNVSIGDGNLLAGGFGTIGRLTINGNVNLSSGAYLIMDIGGLTESRQSTSGEPNDSISISGTVFLRGYLFLQIINGFEMQLNPGQIFTLLTSNGLLSGSFLNVANGERVETTDGLASFQVNYGPDSVYDPDELVLSDPISNAVPEPITSLSFLAGGALLLACRLRRRST